MVRLLILYEMPLDEAAFLKHFHEVHIPLARKVPGIRRHFFGHQPMLIRGSVPVFLVEGFDFDDMDAFGAAARSPHGLVSAQDITDNLQPLSPGMRSMVYEVIEELV
ncbi:conserved hypothetical protein [Bryocella elongata]|uniref:EthD domain-containing protein n=1 Tax=Bryocella elongata TaxID=863522 RepID=A0A1H6BG20_9BACT|nr:EthD family reductase [Bryocella elongata]SEG59582.1 conserved hypothetical protein [Bryocella elongata]